MIKSIFHIKKDIVFVFLFAVFAAFYYHNWLNKGPLNVHLWRQTDCLSLTYNYYEGVPFFEPQMNILLADDNTTGRTAGEFPLLYYIAGNLWKIFGESYFVYRLFYLLILFAGTWAFFKSLNMLLGDPYWAVAIALLLFTSPVYVTYGISFLTDVPAFAFVLIALWSLIKYHVSGKTGMFYVSMGFFALAGLLKVSSMIAFLFLFIVFVLEHFPVNTLGMVKLFKINFKEWAGFTAVFVVVFSWYYYARYYNDLHRLKYTFNNIYPLWIMKKSDIPQLLKNVKNFTSLVFFSRPVAMILVVLSVANLFLLKKIPLLAWLSSIIISAGGVVYFILWAPLMGNHDYYFAAFLVLFPGIILPFLWFIKKKYPVMFSGKNLKILVGIFLVYNFIYCYEVIKLKTFAEDGKFVVVGNSKFKGLMEWINKDVRLNWMRYVSLRAYEKNMGIGKEDKIISLPDKSFNISLFLLRRKGWTDFMNYDKSEQIDHLITKGAKFLFVSDTLMLKKDFLQPFLHKPVGQYKGIEIFRLGERAKGAD